MRRTEAREYVRADGSSPFGDRFSGLADARAKARIDYGPGYRIYFGNDGAALVILLLCGDELTQQRDIAMAQGYWADYRVRKALEGGAG